MADLQEFIEDITTKEKNFCAVCFRTENDRKLVEPIHLSNFIKLTSLEPFSRKEYVCIFCENQASVALKLYNTLSYARHVTDVLYSLIDKKVMTPKSIAYLLPTKIRSKHLGPVSIKRKKLLSSLRRYQALAQTAVLIVDATGVGELQNINNNETITIEEEATPRAGVPRLVPINNLLHVPSQQPVDNVLLYPMSMINGNKILFLSNNFYHANNSNLPILLPDGRIVATPQSGGGQLILQDARVSSLVNVNAEDILSPDRKKATSDVDNVKKTKFVPKIDVRNEVTDDFAQVTKVNSGSAMADSDMCKITNLRSLKDKGGLETPSVLKRADPSIDWEDKIPMDVISFMDANDPNASDINKAFNRKSARTHIHTHAQGSPPQLAARTVPANVEQKQVDANAILQKLESRPESNFNVFQQTLDLLEPRKRGPRMSCSRKRKCEDDDDVIIL
ncbi:uncharacterized protein LOC106139366 [Amyelois transitella]|uniref:uncharacterized protein LOC106139366 n=1 Tax=Amyelois transitella TaxID=680683 RepID=UPI00067BEC5F|nr:uncharacterized protein LOC106139366 [Amyelois transitella]